MAGGAGAGGTGAGGPTVRVSAQDAVDRGLVKGGGPTEAVLREAEKEFTAQAPQNALEAFDMLDRAAKRVDPTFSAGVPADLQPIVAGQDKLLLNTNGIKTLLKANGEIMITDRNGQVILHLVP
jgi:hypothetical protein